MTWLRGIYTDSSLHRMIMSTTGTLLHYLGGRKLRVRLSFVHPWGLLALGRLHLHYYGIGYGATYLEQVQVTRCLVDTVVLRGHSKQTADKGKIYLQVYYLMIEDTSWIYTNGICLSKSSLCLVKLPKKKNVICCFLILFQLVAGKLCSSWSRRVSSINKVPRDLHYSCPQWRYSRTIRIQIITSGESFLMYTFYRERERVI